MHGNDLNHAENNDLRARWNSLWRQISHHDATAPDPDPIFAAYSATSRHYHNLKHIRHCLAEFDSVAGLSASTSEIETAIWFHDVVYDAQRRDNEEASADLMEKALAEAGVSRDVIDRVRTLILATKHAAPPASLDQSIIIDVDLAILGQPDEEFDAYESAIRNEYHFVPDPAFQAARSAVLRNFLERKRIFTTDPFYARYEAAARGNIAKSIAKLS